MPHVPDPRYFADIKAFAQNATYEIGCRFDMKKVAAELQASHITIPKDQEFSIVDRSGDANSPDTGRVKTVEQVRKLTEMGFSAIPHIAARRVKDELKLFDIVARMTNAGARKFLLLAGDPNPPVGDFSTAMDLIRTGVFDPANVKKIFFAAHPYGNPNTTQKATNAALIEKNCYAAEHPEKEICLITQVCYSPRKFGDWLDQINRDGNMIRVRAGVMPGDLRAKFHFAVDVFVKGRPRQDQLRGLKKLFGIAADQGLDGIGDLLKTIPDRFIGAVAKGSSGSPAMDPSVVLGPHFFSGVRSADLKDALRLTHALAMGRFRTSPGYHGFSLIEPHV